jgi:uncharacterized membrane protein
MPVKLVHNKLYLAGILAATCVTIGYFFLLIPNLEFITAAIFISGYLTGPLYGALIGLVAELIFSLFNPYGAPSLPLLAAQLLSMIIVGLCGGYVARTPWLKSGIRIRPIVFGLIGFGLTLMYDILTTLSDAIVMAGGDAAKLYKLVIAGLAFYILHMVSNTISFAVVVPFLLQRLTAQR